MLWRYFEPSQNGATIVVPAGERWIIKRITIVNNGNTQNTFRVRHQDAAPSSFGVLLLTQSISNDPEFTWDNLFIVVRAFERVFINHNVPQVGTTGHWSAAYGARLVV